MSVWTTSSSGRDRNYIVLKHTLRGVNYIINGIKFRHGYAVIEKGSKTYNTLKRIPVLKAAQEFPLVFLRKLSFITRPLDVKLVYGADVFVQYLKVLEAELAVEAQNKKIKIEIEHIATAKCAHRTMTTNGKVFEENPLCSHDSLEQSPTGYCMRHILYDPKLVELGIEVPKFIEKKKKQAMREKVAAELTKLKKQGKF